MLIAVVAGQPVMDTSNFALVAVKVTVAVPAHVASASVIGGFSFDALSSALNVFAGVGVGAGVGADTDTRDRKSTRLNSSHANISYAVFCLKKKDNGQANEHRARGRKPQGAG